MGFKLYAPGTRKGNKTRVRRSRIKGREYESGKGERD
jgi:hypothetical protein